MSIEATPNSLISESSPYLLQHAYNPVSWYPWGEEALQKAQNENKLMLISVGYSACHWCHVMEHECFEDETVATMMNRHFVNIKVDREERPDIDQIYMAAVQLMNNGNGGWPLNCFALPNGKPIYGGTYFPKANWMQLLQYLADYWVKNRDKALAFGEQVSDALQHFEFVSENAENPIQFDLDEITRVYVPWSQHFDLKEGGTDSAPKFPLPVNQLFLLHFAHYAQLDTAHDAVQNTLNKMAWGGIYDQIGGGFARYSTDERWFLPHFEKMLYDNAQVVQLYAEAWQAYQTPLYQTVVEETIDCLLRDFKTIEGAFYCAYDADSEGVEGKFYVWSEREIQNLLEADAQWFLEYYNISTKGNWEPDINILYCTEHPEDFAKKKGLDSKAFKSQLKSAKAKLLKARYERIPPGLDDKIITSWNGLTIKSLAFAAKVFNRPDWLEQAVQAMKFVLSELCQEGQLFRTWKNGKVGHLGFADDYAFVIEALIELHASTIESHWIDEAVMLMNHVVSHFIHESSGLFYYTSDLAPALIARKQEIYDNVIPSSNASLAHSLKTLGLIMDKPEWQQHSARILNNVWEDVRRQGSSHALWADLGLKAAIQNPECVIIGPDAERMLHAMGSEYMPGVVFSGTIQPKSRLPIHNDKYIANKTLIYVCKQGACMAPTESLEEAKRSLLISL